MIESLCPISLLGARLFAKTFWLLMNELKASNLQICIQCCSKMGERNLKYCRAGATEYEL